MLFRSLLRRAGTLFLVPHYAPGGDRQWIASRMTLIRVFLPVAALGFGLLVTMAWVGLLGYGIVGLSEMML